ncbi:MAG: NAD(P)H-hydrate epimerase [Bacteroidota bacterium]
MAFPTYAGPLPRLTTEQMIEVDRLMIEEYGILLMQMMENAGRCLALLAKDRFLQANPTGKKVVVLAGTGGNGGGAMVCARRLAAWGAEVYVAVTHEDRLREIPLHQFNILKQMGLAIHQGVAPLPSDVALIIDGIIGYSLRGAPRGPAATFIQWANDQAAPVLSLDTPSGISLTVGEAFEPVIKAAATLTLALPKVGLYQEEMVPLRGELYLGDISVPPALYAEPSLKLAVASFFHLSDVLRIA